MLQIARANRSSSHHKGAVGNCLGNGFVFFCGSQHGGGTDRRTSLAECRLEWVHYPQTMKTKVAHRPGSRADVERIARVHQHDMQILEFGGSWQALYFTSRPTEETIARRSGSTRVESRSLLTSRSAGLTSPFPHKPCTPLAATPLFCEAQL